MSPEILAPAGDEQTAYIALNAGADAIYLGLTRFSARESAVNLDGEALSRVTRYAHLLGAKVYVALNTLVKDSETDAFFEAVSEAWRRGADAILMQDIFLGGYIKRKCPDIVLHLSTQGGCCNVYGAEVAKEYGFSRVVLARETPISEISKISKIIETEVFVQGALCTCFSGQCYMSSFAGNNSGNRGRCKQPCRKLYSIDRVGYEAPAYALSLSDLSVGERISELSAAGVTSFKIEGRMRRPEYCASAVHYVRACLFGDGKDALSDLMRAYNRGDYTHGLAFGQDERLLSRRVQGHIGEEVGKVKIVHGRPFCATSFVPRKGDGFKILRAGREVAGATPSDVERGGFYLSSSDKLMAGDVVRVTTDTASAERVLRGEKKREIALHVRFFAGKLPEIACEGLVFHGEEPLPPAERMPIAEEQLTACFSKTGELPFAPTVHVETDGVFLPISKLNALRRAFYKALADKLDPPRPAVTITIDPPALPPRKTSLRAVIAEKRTDGDIFIYKPHDYASLQGEGAYGKGAYLYLPPLFTTADEAPIAESIHKFEGIYCEGYYGIALARKYGVKLFAGTGFNLCNRYAVRGVLDAGAAMFALSKEISVYEQQVLDSEGAFVLSDGAIKVMDLGYCPFEKTCSSCDRRRRYTLTDGEGRKFPLRRYVLGGCRFEVYNCAPLKYEGTQNPLFDRSVEVDGVPTRGHGMRSML